LKQLELFIVGNKYKRMIRETIETDTEAVLAMVRDSGQFDDEGLSHVEQTLNNYFDGKSEDLWFTADDGEPVGVTYCAP
jgi:hypothetical protein